MYQETEASTAANIIKITTHKKHGAVTPVRYLQGIIHSFTVKKTQIERQKTHTFILNVNRTIRSAQ